MADTTQVAGTNDKGQYVVNVPRGDVTRIDVVDIDFVVQTKNGSRLIIPGAAMDAMSPKPPTIQFADGPVSSVDMLASVERVETPATSVPAMSSLTEHELKKTEGKKNVTRDGPEGRQTEADTAAQEAQSHQVAPLPQATESSVDKLVAKAEQIATETMKKAFDPAPVKPFEPPGSNPDAPGSQPPTAKIPLLMSLSEGNVVDIKTTVGGSLQAGGGDLIMGAGGKAGTSTSTGLLTGDQGQYSTETITGGAGNDTILADGLNQLLSGRTNPTSTYANLSSDTGLPSTATLYYAKEMLLNLAGYIRRIDSITVSGIPTGLSIQGANDLGNNTWSVPKTMVVPTAQVLTFVYDVAAMRTLFNRDSDNDGVNDYVDLQISFNVKGFGVENIDITKIFILRFQDVDATTDITNNNAIYILGSGWSDIYVMPTASAPHSIDGGAGNDLIYAGNSADSIDGGIGDDTIYAYAGNDVIVGGDGANTIWAGNGNDHVTTGANIDSIYGGNGNDTIIAGAGNDVIDGGTGDDVITAGTGNNAVTGGAGSDTLSFADAAITSVTLTLNANGDLSGAMTRSDGGADTVVSGFENIIGSSGADNITFSGSGNVANTIWGGGGNDVINSGDGNDVVYGESGNDDISASTGNDVVDGGDGADTIRGGAGTDTLTGGAGSDVFLAEAGDGSDEYDGGADTDKVSYAAETANITVNLNSTVTGSGGSATGDTYTSIEWIVGGSGDDTITASTSAVILEGGAGNDYLAAISSLATDNDTTLYGDIRNADGSTGSSTGNTGALLTNWSNASTWANTTANGTNWGNLSNFNGDRLVGSNVAGTTTTMYGGSGFNQYTLQNETDVVKGGTNDATDFDRIIYSGSSAGTLSATGLANSGVFINIDGINHTWTNAGAVDTGSNGYWWNGTGWTQMTGTTAFNNTSNANSGQYGWAAGDTYTDIEQVTGSGNADVIFGNGESNVVNAGNGNDAVFGMGGDDWLFSSAGSDYIDGGADSGVTLATGGDIIDYSGWSASLSSVISVDLSRTAGWVKINGLATASGSATLRNVEGFIGSSYGDTVNGSANADRIDPRGGHDNVSAGKGADIIYGGWGGASGSGFDNLDGGSGVGDDGTADSDWISYSGISAAGGTALGIEVYLADADMNADGNLDQIHSGFTTTTGYSRYDTNEFDTLSNFENVEGSSFADRIAGNTSANIIYGLAGNDIIYGGGGGDNIDGGGGTDTVTYYGIKNDLNALVSVTVDLNGTNGGNAGGAAGDTLVSIENVVGTALADAIYGDGNANQIDGGDGGDILNGGGGADTLWYDSSTSAVTVNLLNNTASGGWAQGDTISNFENLRGSAYNDTLSGDAAVNTLYGGSGNDAIMGNGGADSLYGEGGNDTLTFTNAMLGAASVISGGTAGATETDRITVTDSWTFAANSFNTTNQNNKFVSIEEIYARDGAGADGFSLNSADIQNIVDNGTNSTLTLYLDTGDTFLFSSVSSGSYTQPGSGYSTFTNNGLALAAGTYHLDYTNSSNTQIAHLNLVVG